ncbi:amidoligase family protein [Clostridium akagii]|uniref:amidoligase family protein n=1 Tax=Clostridium akagii TaxID=91623 RepID=UPI00047D858E|nr:amidoligase family protein [Clostridium akagii]
MPKSRRNNTLASGGNTSGGTSGTGTSNDINGGAAITTENAEIVQRVEDRLDGVRTITVNIESRTRRQTEEVQVTLDPNRRDIARVASESGNTYEVNHEEQTCTCMHYISHEDGCRHIDATNTAIGQILNERVVGNDNGADAAGNSVLEGQENVDEINEADRNTLSLDQEDDGFFYEDNKQTFKSMMQGEMEEVPYEYENVLNGSKITFGVELEFVGGNAHAIARELYTLGICANAQRVGYHAPSVEGKWKLERDSSVSSGDEGGELVSPILKDTPETWKSIEKICEVAKRHGATVNSKTGAHVHVGMEPLDTAKQRWKRFFKLIGRYEESIYRFSGGDLGRIRENHEHYAMPFADRAREASNMRFRMESNDDVNRLADSVCGTRYYGINLRNIANYNAPNTVEFRYFNGSLNAKQIQANVKLANGIVMASEKARTHESENYNTTDTMKRRGEMLNNSVENVRRRDETSMRKLIDIAFTRKKDKDAAIEVFSKNTWR